eukprot:3637579-Amphidinium_carterae.1
MRNSRPQTCAEEIKPKGYMNIIQYSPGALDLLNVCWQAVCFCMVTIDEAEEELASLRKSEMESAHQYQLLKQSLTDENAVLTKVTIHTSFIDQHQRIRIQESVDQFSSTNPSLERLRS